jgi:4-amino-4-deoxy-L-arabinose transferase-like glycosyltransferase
VRAFLLHGALLPVLYVVLVPGAWFFHRYFLPTTAATALCWGVLLGGAVHPLARVARWLLPIVGMLSFAIAKGPGHRPEEVGAIEGPVGYLAAMREAVAHVPAGAVVGSMQSGALSWVAPPRVRAVNLDGVVDRESFEALRDARLDDVLVAREVDYFVDWPLQSRVLVERSARPVRLETVWTYEARMCSNHEVILSRVVVPGR